MSEQLIPVPKVKLARLDAAHTQVSAVFRPYVGTTLTTINANQIARSIHFLLDDEDIPIDHIYQTIAQYAGKLFIGRIAELLARQIAARMVELRSSSLMHTEKCLRSEWIACEIRSVRPVAWQDSKPGQMLGLYCLTGHYAGHISNKKVPESWLRWLAYKLGFSRRTQYDEDPRHFIGLRFFGFALANVESAELEFQDWASSPEILKYNRAIVLKRTRMDKGELPDEEDPGYCVFEYDHYCWECPKTTAECIAAVKRETINVARAATQVPGP